MPLSTEVDLGPGHIVLDGESPLRKAKGAQQPLFSAHVYCRHGRPSHLLATAGLLYSMFNKLPVTSNMVLCFVYGFNHNSLQESCKHEIPTSTL